MNILDERIIIITLRYVRVRVSCRLFSIILKIPVKNMAKKIPFFFSMSQYIKL